MIDLKAKRKEKGLTQKQLADKVGVVRTAIGNIECGLALPSIPNAKAIAKVLDFNWIEFFSD